MRQTRIEQYFAQARQTEPEPRSSGISFLDLPLSVREQIYTELGLVHRPDGDKWIADIFHIPAIIAQRCLIHSADDARIDRDRREYGPWLPRHDWDGWKHPWYTGGSEGYGPPVQLFHVSRSISDDARSFFYSRLHFQVSCTDPGGLTRLTGLSAVPTAALRYLTIRMNLCMCPAGENCNDQYHTWRSRCHPACKNIGHDVPLGSHGGSRNDRHLLAELRRACQHLALHQPPDHLNLTSVCDSVDYDLAAQAMTALLLLPRLQRCSISLLRTFDARLRELAEITRLKLTSLETRIGKSFPFRDLPKELQFNALRHTGLVSPYHLYYRSESAPPWLTWPYDKTTGCVYNIDELEYAIEPFCCCHGHRHSVSSWSCNCWHFPVALLSVDHEMRRDAQEIMYHENSWILAWDCFTITAGSPLTSLLDHVRDLTLDMRSCHPGREYHQLWSSFLSRLLARCAPERLTLSILLPGRQAGRTDNEGRLVLSYKVVDYLRRHLGHRTLENLFIFFQDMHLTIAPYSSEGFYGGSSMEDAALSEKLERRVMGDTYHSASRGKERSLHLWSIYSEDPDYLVCNACPLKISRPYYC